MRNNDQQQDYQGEVMIVAGDSGRKIAIRPTDMVNDLHASRYESWNLHAKLLSLNPGPGL